MTDHVNRIAGAPITLGRLRGARLGLPAPCRTRSSPRCARSACAATELGPGRLPARPTPDELAGPWRSTTCTPSAGSRPCVLHRADVDPLVELDRLLPGFVAATGRA